MSPLYDPRAHVRAAHAAAHASRFSALPPLALVPSRRRCVRAHRSLSARSAAPQAPPRSVGALHALRAVPSARTPVRSAHAAAHASRPASTAQPPPVAPEKPDGPRALSHYLRPPRPARDLTRPRAAHARSEPW